MAAHYSTFSTSQGELVKLYERGTAAAEVPAAARGVSWHEYELHMRATERTEAFRWFAKFGAPISDQRIITPRDGYGMKGIGA